ncbi:MAG: transglutaminase family protein [Haliangiales bacterium]
MRIRIKHKTEYQYSTPAALGPHIVRLRPAGHTRTPILSYNLDVEPDCEVRWQHDPWNNRIARLTFEADCAAARLAFTVDAAFDIRPVNPFNFFIDDRCRELPFAYPDGFAAELAPFLATPAPSERLARFVEAVPARGNTVDYLVALNQHVASEVSYIIRNEPGIQTSEETLTLGRGSCRDSAVLLVDVLRSRGLAARFVSGYLVQLADEGNIPDEAKGVARDVVDLHAWAEVYLPGAGWVGLDGTSGLLCSEGHIPLACTVDPALAAPISGTTSEPATGFSFEMEVVRLGHEPRPRKPYTDEVWGALLSAGEQVDARLEGYGLRLTSGGEPTFTSREHPTEPEWNTAAVGTTKWRQGLRMADQLSARLDPGALVMQRMGKLYPGESLPRWALEILWRADGVPIWRDRSRLVLDSHEPGRASEDSRALLEPAERLMHALMEQLGVTAAPMPGYEDPWHFLLAEQNLPVDIDPLRADLDDPEQRRRIARVLSHGLGRPVGYALPLAYGMSGWRAGSWQFRRGRLYLIPGDSPMGLRLPLDRLGGVPVARFGQDPSAIRGPLDFDPRERDAAPEWAALRGAAGLAGRPGAWIEPTRQHRGPGAGDATPASADAAATDRTASGAGAGAVGESIRTTLCVEPRNGVLHVFLPPVERTEHFLDLVAAVEAAAVACDTAVAVEGYRPPPDARVQQCQITPDPGVIEVNLPVCASLREYADYMATVTDAANHAGLCTEKYQLDGREVGSGGGNHITLGGPTPVESPFLRQPQLLAGMLRYIQNHPALSFLFTGLFVGPTSQAPRIDEARHDALYELELALAQVPASESPFPWKIDRLLRNLLVDVAGNGHRSELCIDKLYDPNSPAGRQGLIELRAFEMPPHEHMAAAQMLLARALVARMATAPYEQPLVRWGTELHDRFMLPHYLWADMTDIVSDLRGVGLDIDERWYEPFLDHRCPRMGTLQLGDIHLELRTALEPWPTLGEEPAGSVVARYVDSSLERLQVKVDGVTEGRHEIFVNGVRLPTRATGTSAERIAGVRFRAWQPPHCLQPEIGIHHPLRFDIVDTWAQRSLGACTYHVWHPEGRGFDEPPLTAFEAAARRAQRFTTEGHMPWPAVAEPAEPHPEFPYTLDLRRYIKP